MMCIVITNFDLTFTPAYAILTKSNLVMLPPGSCAFCTLIRIVGPGRCVWECFFEEVSYEITQMFPQFIKIRTDPLGSFYDHRSRLLFMRRRFQPAEPGRLARRRHGAYLRSKRRCVRPNFNGSVQLALCGNLMAVPVLWRNDHVSGHDRPDCRPVSRYMAAPSLSERQSRGGGCAARVP